MIPSSDPGAGELLANLSIGTVVLVAAIFTLVRILLLRMKAPDKTGELDVLPAARSVAEILESLVIAGVLVFLLIRPFLVQAFFIPSESMEPTLLGHDAGLRSNGDEHSDSVHDHIFVNKFTYRSNDPQRDDIIVFKAPLQADQESIGRGLPPKENILIKRLIGLPGESIFVHDGGVYINGKRLNEPFLDSARPMIDQSINGARFAVREPYKLGANELFVMGDNRNNSNDGRFWGPLDRSRVIGKASVIFFPLNRMRVLH